MDVYLVPVAADRYELYCEIPEEPGDQQVEPPTGCFKRLVQRFRDMIDEAERERRHGAPEGTQRGWLRRMRARGMRWVAESIAEQRLLWHLRRQSEACLFFPDELEESKAVAVLRRHLGKDFDKHRFWLAIDSLGLAGAALLTVIPGPNVLAYYFAFRVVGHYLSLRGAKQG